MNEPKASMAVLAKTRAMYGRRIRRDDYREMLHKKSVSEVAGYLKYDTQYRKTLSPVQETLIHRGQLEDLLRRDLHERYIRLSRFSISDSLMYKFPFLKYEIDIVLMALRYFDAHEMGHFMANVPGFLIGKVGFDMLALAQAKTGRDLLLQLDHTRYRKLIEPHYDPVTDKFRRSSCEAALYNDYYDQVFAYVDSHFTGNTAGELRKIFQQEVAVSNTAVIYRMKRYFNGEGEEIRRRLICRHDPRSAKELESLIRAKDAEALIEMLRKGRNISTSVGAGPEDYLDIEHIERLFRLRLSRRTVRMSRSPVVVFVAYMALATIEMENLINIIEGIRYGVPESEIESILVM